MKNFRKVLAIILTAAIMLSAVSVSVFAETAVINSGSVTVENPVYFNSAPIVTEGYSKTPRNAAPKIPLSEEEIISGIRNQMLEMEYEFTFYYETEDNFLQNDTSWQVLEEWLKQAYGTPGDQEADLYGNYFRYLIKSYGSDWDQYDYGTGVYGYDFTVILTYYTTKEQENALDAEIQNVVDSFGFTNQTTNLQKIREIYDYISRNITYDNENLYNEEYMLKFTAYAALMNKTAVCQGYATLLFRMLELAGVDSKIVTGDSQGEAHAWNIVELDDVYYYLDSTWDAGVYEYKYYLKNSADFSETHTNDTAIFDQDFFTAYPISDSSYDIDFSIHNTENINGLVFSQYSNGNYTLVEYLPPKSVPKTITIPATVDGESVVSIEQYAFNGGKYTENIEESDIHNARMDKIKEIIVPENVKYLATAYVFTESFSAQVFHSLEGLESLTLPSTLYYGTSGIRGLGGFITECYNFKEFKMPIENEYLAVEDGVLYNKAKTVIIMYPSAKEGKDFALPNGLISINDDSFSNSKYLEEITIPDTVEYIGAWAFTNSENLKTINISNNSSLETTGQFAFQGTAIKTFNFPQSIKDIGQPTFMGCQKLESITLNGSENAENNYFEVIDGVLYHKETFDMGFKKSLLNYPSAKKADSYEVDDGTEIIWEYAFNFADVKNIVLPETVKKVDSNAFNSSYIESVELNQGLEEIGKYAFSNCHNKNFKFLYIPEGVTTIGKGAFSEHIKRIYLPNSLETIGDDIFGWNESINGDTAVYVYDDSIAENYVDNYTSRADIQKILREEVNASHPDHKFKRVVTKATPTTTGEVSQTCSCGIEYVVRYIYRPSTVTLSTTKTVYSGNQITPAVTVKDSKGNKLTEGTDYTVTYADGRTEIGKYSVTVDFMGNYEGRKELSFEITPKTTSKVTASLYGYDDVKLTWSEVDGIDGYDIYCKSSKTYSLQKSVSASTVSFKKSNLSDGKKYYFKVVPFKMVGGEKVEATGKETYIYTLKKLSTPKVSKYSSKKVKVSWGNIEGESGYQISKSTKSSKTSIVSTYSTTRGKSTVVSASKGKYYYYKVRAYKTVSGKKIYGPWSGVKKYKLK